MKHVVLVLICLMSCSNASPHCVAAGKLMETFRNEVYSSDNLRMIASGGKMMGDIQKVNFNFVTEKQLDIPAARKLYVITVMKLINRLNSDLSVREYLHNYPASIENVEVTISFYQSNGNRVNSNYVAFVYVINNKIYYDKWEDNQFKNIYIETYEEALRKLNM